MCVLEVGSRIEELKGNFYFYHGFKNQTTLSIAKIYIWLRMELY